MPYRSLTRHLDSDAPAEVPFIAPIIDKDDDDRWVKRQDVRFSEKYLVLPAQSVALDDEKLTDAQPKDAKDEAPEAEAPSSRGPSFLNAVARNMRKFKAG